MMALAVLHVQHDGVDRLASLRTDPTGAAQTAVADDLRMQISEGSRRGPRLQAFSRNSSADQVQALPLPSMFNRDGMLPPSTTTVLASQTVRAQEDTAPEEFSTPWPAIPTSSTLAEAEAATTTEVP